MTGSFKCILCDHTDFVRLPYHYCYNGKQIDIVRCKHCKLGTLHPMLSSDEILSFYDGDYFQHDYHCGVSDGTYVDNIEQMRADFQPTLKLIKKYQPNGDFLEIGCAGGAVLLEAKMAGYTTVGVELSAEMAKWGRDNLGIDIRPGRFEDQQFLNNSFDVVFLGDVIEHLHEPKQVLKEIHRVLKPGGIVALAYPMELNHVVPRIRGLLRIGKQSPYKPYHLFYYVTNTLGRLLEACGFRVEMHNESKMIRQSPMLVRIVDSLNAIFTYITGEWGDRGFTIARVCK